MRPRRDAPLKPVVYAAPLLSVFRARIGVCTDSVFPSCLGGTLSGWLRRIRSLSKKRSLRAAGPPRWTRGVLCARAAQILAEIGAPGRQDKPFWLWPLHGLFTVRGRARRARAAWKLPGVPPKRCDKRTRGPGARRRRDAGRGYGRIDGSGPVEASRREHALQALCPPIHRPACSGRDVEEATRAVSGAWAEPGAVRRPRRRPYGQEERTTLGPGVGWAWSGPQFAARAGPARRRRLHTRGGC